MQLWSDSGQMSVIITGRIIVLIGRIKVINVDLRGAECTMDGGDDKRKMNLMINFKRQAKVGPELHPGQCVSKRSPVRDNLMSLIHFR